MTRTSAPPNAANPSSTVSNSGWTNPYRGVGRTPGRSIDTTRCRMPACSRSSKPTSGRVARQPGADLAGFLFRSCPAQSSVPTRTQGARGRPRSTACRQQRGAIWRQLEQGSFAHPCAGLLQPESCDPGPWLSLPAPARSVRPRTNNWHKPPVRLSSPNCICLS